MFAVIVFAYASAVTGSVEASCDEPLILEVRAPQPASEFLLVRINGADRDAAELLQELSREVQKCGRDRSANVIVSDKRPLAVLYEVRALVSKGGLARARFWGASSMSGRMGEILFGEVAPHPGK